MTTTETGPGTRESNGFRHELYPYAGEDAFLGGTVEFIREALESDEAVVVAVPRGKESLLRAELSDAGPVKFVDAAAPGRNPGRLIAAWQAWITDRAAEGRPVRGISETAWDEARTSADRAELRYHEWLLNRAFARSPSWWLLCPYDTSDAEPTALQALSRCHPYIRREGAAARNESYKPHEPYAFEELAAPCGPSVELPFRHGDLTIVRARVTHCADEHGLDGRKLRELLVAVTELATNSIRHADGRGTLRTWAQDGSLVCEFRDNGYIADPLAGRCKPSHHQIGGRGLWLVHQLCDLVEIRSAPETGTVIRVHMDLPG
ncbi:anti-sigma factor RsbA family regulatory protein [Streptomyces sp. NPDC057116]|uniref:anti-sigma factor RsbA family regulatory protein n=1 Tax=Streptomyces sp. NPDC057116 TaxID=3346023 RepID=UPI00362D75F9